ncbi:MAG TPA: hypothetical protein VK661_08280 [Planctomycetota bacterium]|nr:hypothetical protein [Planctomycetota bacterium]
MIRLAIVALAMPLFQETSHDLAYGGKRGDKTPVRGEATLKLKLEGTEAITNLVRSAMEFLSFSEIRIKGEGVRRVTKTAAKGAGIKIEYATARVEGKYDDEPYGFDFERAAPPGDLTTDKLKQTCWFLSMGGPDYRVGPKGEYASNDPKKDAWGEALDLAVNALVRLPEKPVASGAEWTSEWKGAYKQKDNDGIFAFRQKSRLEKVEEKGGRTLGRITFDTSGKLEIPEAKRDKNAEVQETTFETKGTVLLDLGSGLVASHECAGAVRARYKAIDPNTGETHELKIDFEITSKLGEKE